MQIKRTLYKAHGSINYLRFTKMLKCLPEFEYFYCILEKEKLFFSKIRRLKVTDYAALKLS